MNTIKEQFYKTTEQYFLGSYENIIQHESQKREHGPAPDIKKNVFEQKRPLRPD